MTQPELQAILQDIADTKRSIAAIARSLRETMIASQEIIARSRELIARSELQLGTSKSVSATICPVPDTEHADGVNLAPRLSVAAPGA